MRIGVFDSGIGGLTVLDALVRKLPGHDYLYLGDTARVPYGTRSPHTVVRYSLRVASYLAEQDVGAIVIACNTATTHALPALRRAADQVGIQVFGVIEPGVRAARRLHHAGAIAILGTEGTIAGGAYQRALRTACPDAPVHGVPCPLFVPLAEEGWVRGDVPERVAERYLAPLRGQIDTAILGCTHYPLLKPVIQEVLPDVVLVDSAMATAEELARTLPPPPSSHPRPTSFLVTDHVARFRQVGERFLGHSPDPVQWVDIGPPRGPFALPEEADAIRSFGQ